MTGEPPVRWSDELPPLPWTEGERARLLRLREDIKHGYPEHAAWLARIITGWRHE